jgi:hypothetical protein
VPWGLEAAPLGIALTNTCDLEYDKADFLILAAVKPAKEIIQGSKEFRNKLDGADGDVLKRKPWVSLTELLADFIHNASVRRYFFLDGRDALGLDPLFADFQHLISVPIARARSLPKMAILASPDREKLVVHFAAYSSRIGVDRVSTANVAALTALLTHPFHGPTQP